VAQQALGRHLLPAGAKEADAAETSQNAAPVVR